MKAKLHKGVRVKRDENYTLLQTIEREIRERIQTEYNSQTTALRLENDALRAEEKNFIKDAQFTLSTIRVFDKIKVETQVGPGSSIVKEYVGHLEHPYKQGDGVFNMIDKKYYDGKPFSIGMSCLLSIETL